MPESMAAEVDMSEKEEDISEAICAICDNGGDVICCEGKCLRAFHATVEAGSDAACDSLGFSKKQVKEIETFKCENCKYNQHRCYVCGKLGSSDKSAGAEVFQCDTRTCGYFYHPSCVANALPFKYEDEPKDTEAEIASGKPFTCPLHFCYACKESEPEYETDLLMQFAVCRRCPRAYHRKCLPGTISFEADGDKGIPQRAWEELIPNKILIYCMEHMIDDELLTPVRFHIKFPNSGLKKEIQPMESVPEVKIVPRKKLHPSEDFKKRTLPKLFRCTEKSSALKQLNKSSSMWERRFSGPYSLRDRKLLRKRNLFKKNRIGSVKALSELKRKASTVEKESSSSSKNLNAPLSNEDSDATKLGNRESSGSVMQSKSCKVIEGDKDYVATTKLENRKCSGSEKRTKISNEVLDNENSKEIKLENWESCGSEKRSRSSKGAAENRKRSGSVKRTKISNEVLDNENSKEIKLENWESSGSEKRSRSSKGAAESNAATTKKYISNGHEETAYKSMNSPRGMHDSSSRSRTGFMSLGFAPAPSRPFLENSSAGWLNE